MASSEMSWGGLALRLTASLALVYLTYNPEGFSFAHWLATPKEGEVGVMAYVHALSPLKVLSGVVLLVAWVVGLQAARRALGLGGTLLVVALFGCVVWAMVFYGVIAAGSRRALAHIILVAVALVLAVGLSWSHLSRRLSGQLDTDDVG